MSLVKASFQKIKYSMKYAFWVLNGYFGKTFVLDMPNRVTVLITYYNPMRMKHVNHQLRNILKCAFVDKIIISNHNPDVNIVDKLNIQNNRVVILKQDIKRACGYRWRIARDLNPEYLIAIDDDILLFPWQLETLFKRLILEPEVPHGFSGMVRLTDGDFQYFERENRDVHYLCEVYAVTGDHVEKYFRMEELLANKDQTLPDAVERLGDFVVISQTGSGNPKIHTIGQLFRSETFKTEGIALHKENEFPAVLGKISRAVEDIRPTIL